MSSKQERPPYRIAVLDDYQDVALSLADWSVGHDEYHHRALTQAPHDRVDRDPECLDRSEGRRRPGRSRRSYGLHLGADDRTDCTYPGSARHLVAENTSLRGADGSSRVGDDMAGRTLGVLGLGNVGGAVAQIGNAFGMKVIA